MAGAVSMLIAARCDVAGAATHLVFPDGSGDFPTIQAAIDAAIDGDEVLLGDGIFHGDGNHEIDVTKDVVLRSLSDDPDAVVIDCANRHGFEIKDGGVLEIRAITVQRGAPAVNFIDDSSLHATRCLFRENDGGLIGEDLGVGIGITECSFIDNSGTVISLDDAGFFILDSSFLNNSGLCIQMNDLEGVVPVERCSFVGNGRVIDADSEYSLSLNIRDCEFRGNLAPKQARSMRPEHRA